MNLALSTENSPELAVVVSSLMPRMWLRCKQPVNGYPEGYLRKLYGGNISEGSVYADGPNNPGSRMYMETGGNEILFEPLKKPIEEIIPADNPDLYELVMLEPKVIQLNPVHIEPCRVIQHPATFFVPQRIEKPASQKRRAEPDPKQLFLFPTDLNQTA